MKKKNPDHINLERWLVSYADFMTLMFAFFVVMYAISQADIAKFRSVSESMKKAFGGTSAGMVEMGGMSGGSTIAPFENVEPPGGRVLDMAQGKTHTAAEAEQQLKDLKEILEETITLDAGLADVADKLQVQYDSRGLVLRLAVKGFFEAGKTDVHPDLLPLLDRIGKVLSRSNRQIRIEGHSDPVEKAGSYRSSWELSAGRASWVAERWIQRLRLDPRRISVAGYAHYRPVSENADEHGQLSNRRVEIIVLNSQIETKDSKKAE